MPRQVDHDARRASLADAVLALVARGGVEAVSLRSVAAEAAVSMGRVQYYFATKDDLLLHGLERAHRSIEARIEQRVAGADGDEPAVLVAILAELLGEHPETRDAIRVHAAFSTTVGDDRRNAVLTDGDDEILALAVRVVAASCTLGDVDPELDGHALVTLAGGLGQGVALRGASLERARATLRHQLRRLEITDAGL